MDYKKHPLKNFKDYHHIYYRGTAILSKYPIRHHNNKKTESKNRFIAGTIILPENHTPLHIICLHLDYQYEGVRLREIKDIMSGELNDIISRPCVMLGDFNSLTQDDYSMEKWKDITRVRQNNHWELPKTQVTSLIVNQHFYDSKDIAEDILGPVTSCRFHTRIDYVYVNKLFLTLYNIKQLETQIAIPYISDHNLVNITCYLKVKT